MSVDTVSQGFNKNMGATDLRNSHADENPRGKNIGLDPWGGLGNIRENARPASFDSASIPYVSRGYARGTPGVAVRSGERIILRQQ